MSRHPKEETYRRVFKRPNDKTPDILAAAAATAADDFLLGEPESERAGRTGGGGCCCNRCKKFFSHGGGRDHRSLQQSPKAGIPPRPRRGAFRLTLGPKARSKGRSRRPYAAETAVQWGFRERTSAHRPIPVVRPAIRGSLQVAGSSHSERCNQSAFRTQRFVIMNSAHDCVRGFRFSICLGALASLAGFIDRIGECHAARQARRSDGRDPRLAAAVSQPTILLSSADISALMKPADYLKAVESGFIAARKGQTASPHPLHIPVPLGGFHAKGAHLASGRGYVALKLNGNLPGNPERTGLPTIQGALLLCDAASGSLLAVMDSIEITLRRTAAASALAARHLARPNSRTLLICGCGQQAGPHVEALIEVLPIRRIFAWDIGAGRAASFAERMSQSFDIAAAPVSRLEDASRLSDVIVTCTTSRTAFLTSEHVSPGAFIAAVGADSSTKSEITPQLMERATVVVDVLDQCVDMGDLRLAIASSALSLTDVYGDLGELADGAKPGRTHDDEITLFDSTGTAIEDVASAAMIYERARSLGRGLPFVFAPA